GIRVGMLIMVPLFLIGGLVLSATRHTITGDITQVWKAAAARSEALLARRQGRSKLLLVRDLEVGYGNVQVLFGVNLEIDEGEIVALLGTNGAGKSTLLNAICGVTEADRGAVIFDGRDITHAPPNEIALHGVAQVPGGKGVFTSLSVGENLELAAWAHGTDDESIRRVRELFPILTERRHDPAGNLSGGQQQMLALAMAFLSRPRLLLIDELSLGLAPTVVAQLLPVITELKERGTTIVLVEQSVNVALEVAEHAYFMEKGEVRFSGPTAELLERPDVLRSVFLAGTGGPATNGHGATDGNGAHGGPDHDGDRGTVGDGAANGGGDTPAAIPALGPWGGARTTDGRAANGDGVAPAGTTGSTDGPGPAVLEVRGVSRAFGGITAVNDVSFDLGASEVCGIIGPNGAGKTTLFDLLSGFVTPDAGRIVLGGIDVTGEAAHTRAQRGLGRSFQDARLFPSLTVTEVIATALERWVATRDPLSAALHLPNAYSSEVAVEQRVDELVELLGLGAYRNKFVGELSTGTRRIVDIAALLAHRPNVILLDEPSSGIAQREVEALAPLLGGIRDHTGASLVVIEHDMSLLRTISDRMIAMEQGAVIATGSPDEVLEHPLVVESYLGTDAIDRTFTAPGAT
ncbi:MAG: ATP-binding cassette domain-containing protein, partial [Actinomycetota bacterium]|nr:ATP-binding cassette domain-containing protein [Actinomycetota bacterium]